MAYLRESAPVLLLAATVAVLIYGGVFVAYLLETTP